MTVHLGRRQLLRLASALGGMLALRPVSALAQEAKSFTWRNWSDSQYAEPKLITAPQSEEALTELLQNSTGTVRPIGSGHSWSPLVPTDGTMITLDAMMGLISHDPETLQAEVWGGTKLFLFGPMLEQVGQAVMNMSDINYQSLAGAVATSTHGTGATLGSMSAYVKGFRLITPGGETIDCDENSDGDVYRACLNSLGSLGVTTRLRFQNQAAHRLHQQEWLGHTDEVLENIQPLIDDNQQFELFPIPNSNRSIVVTTNAAADDAEDIIEDDPYGVETLRDMYKVISKLPLIDDFVYDQGLDLAFDHKHRIGPSYAVLAHPRVVRFIEMEYTVPADKGVDCLRDVLATIREKFPDVCFPLEYRYIKADDSLIGMFSEQDGCAISVHQFADESNTEAYLATIEQVFHKYQGRPHWGKWHSLKAPQLQRLYPHWDQFRQIQQEIDPGGRMLNPHLRELLGIG